MVMHMSNEFIAPIDHSTASAAASTVAGGAGGAIKGGFGGAVTGFMAPILTGAALFGGIALIVTSGFTLGAVGIAALVGAGLGAFLAPAGAQLGAILGGLFGGAKGAARASDEVKMERGAAAELQAKVDIIKAQSGPQATTTVFAPSATNNNNRGITAPSTIMTGADNVQYDDQGIAGAQLAAGAAR